eukprot:3747131-Rhodomonas_salina.1
MRLQSTSPNTVRYGYIVTIARYPMPKLPKNGRSLPEIQHPLCPPDLLSQINQTDRDQKQQEATPQLE